MKKLINLIRRLAMLALLAIVAASLYINTIPRELLEQAGNNPEMQSFVYMYPLEHRMPHNRDVTKDLSAAGIPLFIQWDRRWGYERYGSGVMAVTGCGPTSLAMVASGLSGNAEYDPYTIALFSEKHGYYVSGEGSSWALMSEGAALLGLKVTAGEPSAEYIRNNLSESTPMICSVTKGDFTTLGHFIVLTGIDENGNVTVHDPNSRANSARLWPVERLIPQIAAIWEYSV